MRALALVTAALAACVDVSGSQRASLLGACTFSDECPSPLLCAAGRCRAQCRTDRDCVNDWRCLSAGTADQSVCYAPDDYANACVWSSQCRGGRVCGGDRVCRKQCLTDYDCRVIDPNLWCVAPGLCSSHPFLDGGVPTDVDLNLLSGAARADATTSGDVPSPWDTSASSDAASDAGAADAPRADAASEAGTADAPPTDAGATGPAEMPTVVSGTGCGPRADARSCAPGTPGCDVVEIQASREGTARCVRFSDGSARCWGNGYANTFGIGGIAPCLTPFIAQRLHGARTLELGGGSGCAMFTRGVWCWGSNFQNNVGVGTAQTPLPTALLEAPDGLGNLTAGHGNTTCLVRPDGTLRCWGQNTGGELGQGDNLPRVGPVTVPLTDVLAVAPGETHVCALRRDRTVWCWGANCAGQCGQAPSRAPGFPYPVNCGVRVLTPTQVPGLADVQQLVAGRYFSCARLADRSVRCWGWNDEGALGLGGVGSAGDFRDAPTPVMGINDAESLSTPQGYGACVLRADRTVSCWGGDSNGGAMGVVRGRPYQVPSLTDVRALAPRAPCVVRLDGEVWCWAGQIGDGQTRGVMAATRVIF
jgi:alpha-tubulin suppressor-like RCC1 family protein